MARPGCERGIMIPGYPVKVFREQTDPADSAGATARTCAWMGWLAREAARDPLLKRIAAEIREKARSSSRRALCAGVWEYVKRRITFVHDDEAIRRLFGEADQLELLISPAVLLRMERPEGDCDDFAMCCASLLLCLRIEPTIVPICCDRERPGRFSHVFAESSGAEGRFPLDASHGGYFGWEVPIEHTYRRQGWDVNGRLLFDELPTKRAGVGAYEPRGASPMIVRASGTPFLVRRRSGLRGLGADWGDESIDIGASNGSSSTTLDFSDWFGASPTLSGQAAGSSSSGDHAIRDTLLGLAKQAGNIFQQKFAPLNPGEYIQTANGMVRARDVPGAVPTPNTGLNVTAGGMSGTTLLLLFGLGGVALYAATRGGNRG